MENWQKKQWDSLQDLLLNVYTHSRYYRALLVANGLEPDKIRSWEDFRKIPFTTKEHLNAYNEDFLCVDKSMVADYVTTSGTAGDPVWFALTEQDLDRLAYNEALSYESMRLKKGDLLQLTTTLDRRFMAGMAYFLGARRYGLGVVRVGSGVPELQWDTISKIKPTALVCVPSFLLKMLEYAEEQAIDFKNSSVKKILCIGEPIRNQDFSLNTLALRITEKWDVQLFSTYASTEMGTAFTECEHGIGGHLHPDLLITELVNEDGTAVEEGEAGELVITTLGVEGMPLIRFRTGDMLQSFSSPCPCGRTSPRLGPVLGRKNQMIKYKGTTLYPPALFDLLNDFKKVTTYVVEISSNDLGEDEILVRIGIQDLQALEGQEELLVQVKDRFRAKLRVTPKIVLDTAESVNKIRFPENSRKSVGFIDKRTGRI